MNGMDGNPHVTPLADAIVFSADGTPHQKIEFLLDNLVRATHAVAYEQRTANLLHAFEVSLRAQSAGFNVDAKTIDARLGLNQGETK